MFYTLTPVSKSKAEVPVIVWNEAIDKRISISDALWDSGSSQTLISEDVADELGIIRGCAGSADTPNGDMICWPASFSIVLPDHGIFEIEGLVMKTRLKKHVVIGMDIMEHGQTCIDVVEKEGAKFVRLQFCPENQLANLSIR